jgi:antitoxin (DNA-binding transcriptional repressor) of toxin-antitoxin stability system
MAKDVIHISEAEAASDFVALMARVRAGAKVIIEHGGRLVAVLHAAEPERRSISECIALAKAHEEETGKAPVLDPNFAEGVEDILGHRKPWRVIIAAGTQRPYHSGNPRTSAGGLGRDA